MRAPAQVPERAQAALPAQQPGVRQAQAGVAEGPREEREPGQAASARRRRPRQQWLASRWRRASTTHWCRSSRRCHRQRASCRCSWLGQTRPWAWQAQPMRKASPPCSVSSCFSSRGMPQLPAKRSNRKPIVLGDAQHHGGYLPRRNYCAIGVTSVFYSPDRRLRPGIVVAHSLHTPRLRMSVAFLQPCWLTGKKAQSRFHYRLPQPPGWPA